MKAPLKKLAVFLLAMIFIMSAPKVIGEKAFGSSQQNVITVTDNMIIYVPLRNIAERLGGIVEYDSALRRILIVMPDETKISHIPGTNYIILNGSQASISLPSVMEGGITYMPVTVLRTIFKNAVDYDSFANAVSINTDFFTQTESYVKLLECAAYEHFLSENLFRYLDYIKKNPDISADAAAAFVNTGVDKEFYNDIRQIGDPSDIKALCTKLYSLPEDYIPEDLVYITGTGYQLRREAAAEFANMQRAAMSEGLYFYIYSAYRSYDTQQYLYETYSLRDGTEGADEYSARPGHSEHQAGLAVDLMSVNGSEFASTAEFEWMINNAHKYGFILRYPDGYSDITGYTFESWHWRYIGPEDATRMYEENISTYEEYCGRFLLDIIS